MTNDEHWRTAVADSRIAIWFVSCDPPACPRCSQEHSLYWPHAEPPDPGRSYEFICPVEVRPARVRVVSSAGCTASVARKLPPTHLTIRVARD